MPQEEICRNRIISENYRDFIVNQLRGNIFDSISSEDRHRRHGVHGLPTVHGCLPLPCAALRRGQRGGRQVRRVPRPHRAGVLPRVRGGVPAPRPLVSAVWRACRRIRRGGRRRAAAVARPHATQLPRGAERRVARGGRSRGAGGQPARGVTPRCVGRAEGAGSGRGARCSEEPACVRGRDEGESRRQRTRGEAAKEGAMRHGFSRGGEGALLGARVREACGRAGEGGCRSGGGAACAERVQSASLARDRGDFGGRSREDGALGAELREGRERVRGTARAARVRASRRRVAALVRRHGERGHRRDHRVRPDDDGRA